MNETGSKKTERFFFVDMENVHRNGIKGVGELNEKDCVRIYYSNPLENIPIQLHLQILESKAKFEYVKVEFQLKNAADMMILLDIKETAKKHKKSEFIIISNDADFDAPIAEFREMGVNAKKMPVINSREDIEREENIRRFIVEHFSDIDISEDRGEIIEKTVQAVLNAKTKSQVNLGLLKIYDSQSVKLIYNELKPLLKDLPGK